MLTEGQPSRIQSPSALARAHRRSSVVAVRSVVGVMDCEIRALPPRPSTGAKGGCLCVSTEFS
jgi:hypothetical protein